MYFLTADDGCFLKIDESEDRFADPAYSPSWGYSVVTVELSFVGNDSLSVGENIWSEKACSSQASMKPTARSLSTPNAVPIFDSLDNNFPVVCIPVLSRIQISLEPEL